MNGAARTINAWNRVRWLLGVLGVTGMLALTFVSCGDTGGDSGVQGGNQFVSQGCLPEDSCLSLTINPRFLQANNSDVASFIARLIDDSGNVLVNEQICFSIDDPTGATIFDPATFCQLTDSFGSVSGKLRSNRRTGSFRLIATPTTNFGLTGSVTFVVGGGDDVCLLDLLPDTGLIPPATGQRLNACTICADGARAIGAPVNFSGCPPGVCTLSPVSDATDNNGCATTILRNQAVGGENNAVQVNISATSGFGGDVSTFILGPLAPTATPLPTQTPRPECSDMIDNDGDGCTDQGDMGGDPSCSSTGDNSESPPDAACRGGSQCQDGLDNDGDGCTDFSMMGGDPSCSSIADNSEGPGDPACVNPPTPGQMTPATTAAPAPTAAPTAAPQCNDNIDNDSDGCTDFESTMGQGGDPGCASAFDNNEGLPGPPCF